MRRKGAIEIQFNWMFVLIAGAIILSFFVVFVLRQQEASEQKLSAALIKDLETKITSARVSGGSAAELDLHDLEILFSCEDYRIKGVSESINYRALFTPDRVKGSTMLLWSIPWSIPFKVTNLLFITSPKVRYVIVDTQTGETGLANSVFDRMSNKFLSVDYVLEQDFDTTVNVYDVDKIKIVCFDCNLESFDMTRFVNFADPNVKAVSINQDMSVEFFYMDQDKLVSEGKSPYFGTDSDSEATMYAAIFANDKNNYDCNMRKALNSLLIVAEVYKQRMISIQEDPDLVPALCSDYYSTPLNYIDKLSGAAKNDFTDPSVNVLARESLSRSAQMLDDYQNKFIRRESCPLVY